MSDEKTARVRTTDAEVQALAKIDRLLADLEDDAVIRVLTWANDKFAPAFTFAPIQQPGTAT